MTWREKTIARILLILAMLLSEDPQLRRELQGLGNHIAANAPAREEVTS